VGLEYLKFHAQTLFTLLVLLNTAGHYFCSISDLIAEHNAGKAAEKAAKSQWSRSVTKPNSDAICVD
jgi:hypothetical protein